MRVSRAATAGTAWRAVNARVAGLGADVTSRGGLAAAARTTGRPLASGTIRRSSWLVEVNMPEPPPGPPPVMS